MLKRTPLFAAHQKAGGKLIEFGGWEMPVQYSSIVDEHLTVRRAAGLFDISHMGEVQVRGAGAASFLNSILTNDVQKLAIGQGQYTLMCNPRGGVIDDLYLYRIGEREFFLIINASRIEVDVAWMQAELARNPDHSTIEFRNVSDAFGAVALQGPRSPEILETCFPLASTGGTRVTGVRDLVKNQIGIFETSDCGALLIARTGYTGEDGFEIVARNEYLESMWERILCTGQAHGCKPTGLGARDTLRTEMGFPLYGHELTEEISPVEAGLGVFVSLTKGNFNGSEILTQQKAQGVTRRCVAFRMAEKSAPPRPHYSIWSLGGQVGEVVSGTQSPSLGVGIGMGYVPPPMSQAGTPIEIEVRGKRWPATLAKKPLYTRPMPPA